MRPRVAAPFAGLAVLACALFVAPIEAQERLDRITLIAPAAPGGGWDQTARAMQRALEADRVVRLVHVENVPGAAGVVGLAQFVNDPPQAPALLVTGLVMVGAVAFNNSPVSLVQTTPIARLTGEYEVIVVPRGSTVRDMRDLVARFRADPATVSWGGGSAGGTDHILAGLIAEASGVDPSLVNYIAFSGGGEAVAAALGGQITAAISGYSEFAPHIQAGRLRALAISAPARQPGIEVPPLSELGIGVSIANWRGVVAPPNVSEDVKRHLTDTVARMRGGGTWQTTLSERGWSDQWLDGDAFRRFLDAERMRVTRIAGALRRPDPALASTARVFPIAVLSGALTIALALAVGSLRDRWGPPFSTVRQTQGRPAANLRPVGLMSIGLALYTVLLPSAGFVIASTILFWVAAVAIDSRRWVTDAGMSILFAWGAYVIFTRALDVSLPAGWLATWIR
jgi:putative tricarboxylic transport membrane protein